MPSPESRLTAAARLRAALDATAGALAQADLEGLLAAEAALTGAFADLPELRAAAAVMQASPPTHERTDLRDELMACRAALLRARRLGASLGDVVRLSLYARGQSTGYDPARVTAATLTGRGIEVRG